MEWSEDLKTGHNDPMKSTFRIINRMVADGLDAESLAQAIEVEIPAEPSAPAIKVSMLRAEHVVATALKVGRPKDFIRISQFLSEKAVDLARLHAVLERHGLLHAWSKFCAQTGNHDPYGLTS